MQTILAARSNFSIGESILTVEQLVEDAQKVRATAVALTDTMTVTGLVDFTNRAKKAGVKPIIGCRLRLVDNPLWRKEKGKKEKQPPAYFLTWIARTEAGLQALYRLLTLAHSPERFYYEAKLGFDDLFDALKSVTPDDVFVASSDVHSVLVHDKATEILQRIADALSRSNVFLTLSPIDAPLYDTLNKKAIEIGTALDLPFLVTRPTLYSPQKDTAHEIMGAITANVTIDQLWHKTLHTRDFHALDAKAFTLEIATAAKRLVTRRGMDAARVASAFKSGVANTDALVTGVSYQWTKQAPSLPKMAPDEFAAVVAECKKGWAERFGASVFGHKPDATALAEVYKPRLAYELEVLKKLNFSGYFLLVQDVVRFAKGSGILVGPGRGSVGGSLVAYLMGITDCDPIRFNLLFERFINPDRLDLPDADLDFMSKRRNEVVDYLVAKYGPERVAGVANYMALGTASSIRDVSRVCGLAESDYRCSKFAPKAHGAIIKLAPSAEQVPEIAAFRDANPALWQVCLDLEGTLRNLGQHAAGIVVAGCDLTERAFIDRRKGAEGVVCWDKKITEDQGLIKMDILGLNTLDLIDLVCAYIKERHGRRLNLSRIPLDDADVLDLFAKGKTTGIFQFEGGSSRRMLKDIANGGALTFDDIVAVNALNRPGPLDASLDKKYIERRNGREAVDYPHPAARAALESTYGVLVYQEQLMQMARDLSGFTAPEADLLRKAVGKKDPVLMAAQGAKFIEGAAAGYADVTLEDGTTHRVHRHRRFKVVGKDEKFTIEEVLAQGLSLAEPV